MPVLPRAPGQNGETNYPSDFGPYTPNGFVGPLYQQGGGLNTLTGAQPNPGPADPYNHAKVQKALDIIEQNPGISVQMMQTIMSEALGPAQAQIDQRQQAGTQAFDTASQGLMGLATSGYGTPEGLNALTGAYQAISPQLNRPKYAGQLEGLTGSLGDVAATVPSATDSGVQPPEPLGGDSFAQIDIDLTEWASGKTPKPDGQPYALHDVIMAVTQPLRAQGYSEEDLQRVIAYVTQKWQFLKSGT